VNTWLLLLTGFAFGIVLSLPAGILIFRRVAKRQQDHIENLKTAHRSDWQTLISLLNHTGMIPHEATALGLTELISRALSRCIYSLKMLLREKDYRTGPVIEELEGIALAEMEMLHDKLEDVLKAQRNHLRNFDFKQNGSESSNQNP